MRRLFSLLGLLSALTAGPALASNCPTFTYILSNGTTADANQVMANFNTLLNCSNNNLAHSGTNDDITSALALTTAPSLATIAVGAAVANLGYTPVNKAGDTMSGNLVLPAAIVTGAAATNRVYEYQTAGINRWVSAANGTAESGSNAGSDFQLLRYADSGSFLDAPITVTRSSGVVVLADGLVVNQSVTVNSGGNFYVSGAAGTPRSLHGQTSGSERWQVLTGDSSAESGSNAGSNYAIYRYSDAGSSIDQPFAIIRSTGTILMSDGLSIAGGLTADTISGPLTGNVTGNASTATKWATARVITLTGAVTSTCPSFDGSAPISCTTAIGTGVASLTAADQTQSGGANLTAFSIGTVSSGTTTIDCGKNPAQFLTNGGAFTLAAPANDGECMVLTTNNGSAGTIAFSGFSVGAITGDPLDTTNGHKFTISVWRINGTSGYRIAAHQ